MLPLDTRSAVEYVGSDRFEMEAYLDAGGQIQPLMCWINESETTLEQLPESTRSNLAARICDAFIQGIEGRMP